jgi:hypothetical protein
MSQRNRLLLLLIILVQPFILFAQDDLMNLLNDKKPVTDYATATFKTSRIVIGQSIENPAKGDMLLLITHHFGALNTGYENLFGLKQSAVRIGMEYGLTKRIGFGFGLNSDRNTWDGFLKVKILRQSKGAKRMPISLSVFGNTAIYTTKWEVPERKNYFSSRISYAMQVLVARKFGNSLSLQLTPSYVHRNMVASYKDHNDVFTVGIGGRVKISERMSINAEYHYLIPGQIKSVNAYSSLSAGIDIETGGHVFQIFLTNSAGENEEGYLTETHGKWSNGNIFLGFNITRIFTIIPQKFSKE